MRKIKKGAVILLFVQFVKIDFARDVKFSKFNETKDNFKFYPVDKPEEGINNDVFYHCVDFSENIKGLNLNSETVVQFDYSKLNDGDLSASPFGNKVSVRKTADDRFEVHFGKRVDQNTFSDKAVFTLADGKYGRVMYNIRINEPETGEWCNQLYVYNFINAPSNIFRYRMFINRNPDFEFVDFKLIR